MAPTLQSERPKLDAGAAAAPAQIAPTAVTPATTEKDQREGRSGAAEYRAIQGELKVAEELGRYQPVVPALENFLTRYPQSPHADSARFDLGFAHFQLGNYKEAAINFGLVKEDREARYNAALAYVKAAAGEKEHSASDALLRRAVSHSAAYLADEVDAERAKAGVSAWVSALRRLSSLEERLQLCNEATKGGAHPALLARVPEELYVVSLDAQKAGNWAVSAKAAGALREQLSGRKLDERGEALVEAALEHSALGLARTRAWQDPQWKEIERQAAGKIELAEELAGLAAAHRAYADKRFGESEERFFRFIGRVTNGTPLPDDMRGLQAEAAHLASSSLLLTPSDSPEVRARLDADAQRYRSWLEKHFKDSPDPEIQKLLKSPAAVASTEAPGVQR